MISPSTDRSNRKTLILLALIVPVLGMVLFSVWQRWGFSSGDEFTRQMNAGKNYLDTAHAEKAIGAFQKAVSANPTHPDAHLNLANAYLLAGQSESAIQHAREVLNLDQNSAAACFVLGCAHLRLSQFEEALKALEQSSNLDPSVAAALFQRGIAHQHLKHWDEAIASFQATVELEPEHPAAHYNLSQALIRANRQEEANQELELHRQISSKTPNQPTPTPATYERSVHTQARVPFQLEQPGKNGIKIAFADVTKEAFAPAGGAQNYQGPVGVIDVRHDGNNGLFVAEGEKGFRLLINTNGAFVPHGEPLPGIPGATYTQCLIGDLNNNFTPNDRSEDAIVLGPQGSHVFKFTTNGTISEYTPWSRLNGLQATQGALVDLDFTGSLDLIAVTATNDVRVFRNLGNMLFKEITSTSGVPASLTIARELIVDDWNNDDLMDLFVTRTGQSPMLLVKQRGGPLVETNLIPELPSGGSIAVGDLNNDLRNDLVVATSDKLECFFGGLKDSRSIPRRAGEIKSITLFDYDNDGWLDICATGPGLSIWRNLGQGGFKDMTDELGFAQLKGNIKTVATADFDSDGDTDLLFDIEKQGLQLWRNNGGNANNQLKVRLLGNRSNPSGLGVRVEATAGGLRTIRTIRQLPVEIGVGRHKKLESLTVHWFDLSLPTADVEVVSNKIVEQWELVIPGGSCPYLYAWDGERFRFVTDLLGASPLGLPMAEGRYIEADPDEYVWIGNEKSFKPRGGDYLLSITEELREVLYLDEAKLVVVDHPAGTEVYPTDKLLPGKPFPRGELATLHHPKMLLRATRNDGLDVTEALAKSDGRMASPVRLRAPQLRGLAEPYGITLDFGPLETGRPLVLALTGWLRFGGGMANMAASHVPDLPFPFPSLEVETGDGHWKPVDVVVGAPAGKTKRMLVDLSNKLPPQSRRLRVNAAFEIHWDEALLFERDDSSRTRIASLAPARTDLHWRGFSEFENLPSYLPLTPDYAKVRENANWRITPSGWCTRYGPVNELVAERDDALVLLNGGDELILSFPTQQIPEKPAGYVRDFFLFSVGWDKDADFHVAHGTTVEPLPFHGMDDQRYGLQKRPALSGDGWMEKYNTRWVGPLTLNRDRARQVARKARN
jgi:tetratricopeptide (TPR) repeat protein